MFLFAIAYPSLTIRWRTFPISTPHKCKCKPMSSWNKTFKKYTNKSIGAS
jgi:hypothetical protein